MSKNEKLIKQLSEDGFKIIQHNEERTVLNKKNKKGSGSVTIKLKR